MFDVFDQEEMHFPLNKTFLHGLLLFVCQILIHIHQCIKLIKTFCWRYPLDFLNLSEGECLAHSTREMITFRWQNSQWIDLDPGGDCNYLFKIYSWHLWSDGRELWKYVLWLLQWTFSEVWCLTRFLEGGMTNGLWGVASFI